MGITLAILLWALLSVFMVIAVDVTSFWLKRSGWKRFLSTFLFFYAQVIVSEFTLGALSILTAKSLVISNLLISGGLLLYIVRQSKENIIDQYFSYISKSIKKTWLDLKNDPFLLILVILSSAFLLWVLFLGILFPAIDFDGNSYHLTFIGYVVQNHNFFDAPTSLKWLFGYPKGGEFIQMWSVIIPRNDMFADLAQLPFLGLGIYALYEIGRKLGINKRHAKFAALLFVFLPVVLNQLKTTYVDVMLCSLFFASIAVVLEKKLSNLELFLLGMIFSLIISVKSTGLLFVVAVIPLLLFNLYRNRSVKNKKIDYFKTYIKPFLFVAIPTVFGLYWYIKNWIVYGSPIYPFGFKLLGTSIFPGPTFQEFAAGAVSNLQALPKGCASRIWFVWTEQKDWFGCFYNYDTNYAGLGPVWFVLLIPAALLGIWHMVRNKRYELLAVMATIAGLFVIYPTNYYSRYTMFVSAIGILGFGFLLSRLSAVYTRIIKTIALFLVLSVMATNFVLCNFPPRTVKDQIKNLSANSNRGPVYEINPGKAFTFIGSKLQPSDHVIYDSSPYFIYPLWRTDFGNKVSYLPSVSKEDWLKKLKNSDIDYVFTTVWSKENKWAQTSLESIYKDDTYEIFKTK